MMEKTLNIWLDEEEMTYKFLVIKPINFKVEVKYMAL